ASTIRNKQGIKKIFFSQQDGDDFIVQWLHQLFNEAEQVNADNQYITEACTIDKTIPYSMEVPIVGFNSSRFDISLIISQMQCKDWTISNYIGSASTAKQVIVHHKKLNLKVKFVDMLTYLQPMELKCLPTNLTDIDVYHLIRKWITGGLSNVMHRVNRSGIDFIKRLWYDKDNKKVTVLTTDHRITHVVGVGFNSLYRSVMSSEPHKFIKYTGGKMYMCGSQTAIRDLHKKEDYLLLKLKVTFKRITLTISLTSRLFQGIMNSQLMKELSVVTCIVT
ncbi:MAG: hypothetical protein EZS28_040819, partial [Streblomastix strix]